MTPRLVLLNGAPGSGKTTLARRYINDRSRRDVDGRGRDVRVAALPLALDVDTVRSMLGGWLDAPTEAGLLARRMALAMARVALSEDREVVVPQFLGRLEFVSALERLAAETGADFVEVALLSDPDDAVRRFARRSAQPQTPGHRDATVLQERSGGAEAVAQSYERLMEVVAARPATRVVRTVDGEVEQTYRRLLAALAG